MTDEPLEILFVCVHNAGRSQMAAAFASTLGGDRVVVRSAGSAPAADVHANVVSAMAEVGVDLTRERPKLLTDGVVRESDIVITMGCGDACPIYPGKRYVDWVLDDPSGVALADVRRIRGAIRLKVESLLRQARVIAP